MKPTDKCQKGIRSRHVQEMQGLPVGELALVLATIAEPLAMPQPGQAGRPNAIQAGEVAGRSIAPDSVDVPLPLSVSVYSSV